MLSCFPFVWIWFLCQKSIIHRCMGLFLELQFSSIDQPVSFCTAPMKFFGIFCLLFITISTAWSTQMVIPPEYFTTQNSFSYPLFLFLLMLSFWYEVEKCTFKVWKELCWNFDGDYIESVDTFGKMAIFTVNPTDPWT